jgi:hypothetical protein
VVFEVLIPRVAVSLEFALAELVDNWAGRLGWVQQRDVVGVGEILKDPIR